MNSVRASSLATKVGGLVALGLVAGIAAKAADGAEARWINDLANYPAAWVLALSLVGRFASTPVQAAIQSSAFFVAMCLGYYGWSAYVLEFTGVAPYLLAWAVLAVTAVPMLATAVWWAAARRGAAPGLVMGSLAGVALAGGAIWQLWLYYGEGVLPQDFPLHPVQAVVDLAVAVIIVGLLPKHGQTRLWALLLTMPMALLAGVLFNWAYGNLPLG